ncbi:hypothetical protein [Mastigocoleus sp. MO_188.B34]|nr:hypothetical protein [Mastigocoleus sp. MO_188.B34]MDJ0693026.1 hypothetical protein [Mastigocoleus sp. MO_188.B34]
MGISISYPENPSLGRYNRNAKSNAKSRARLQKQMQALQGEEYQ